MSSCGQRQNHLCLTQFFLHVTQWERGRQASKLAQRLRNLQTWSTPSLCYLQATAPWDAPSHPIRQVHGAAGTQSNHAPWHIHEAIQWSLLGISYSFSQAQSRWSIKARQVDLSFKLLVFNCFKMNFYWAVLFSPNYKKITYILTRLPYLRITVTSTAKMSVLHQGKNLSKIYLCWGK